MTCKTCGSAPCCCAQASLANPIISGGVFSGPVINGPTINGGTINNSELVAVQIDIASTGETSAPGVCDEHIATNAFVCTAISNALSGTNPAFCSAVSACILADPSAVCTAIALCIASTPGIINTTAAFGFNARATTALHGVVRYALQNELENGSCLLAIDPCTLIAAWTTPNVSSPFWTAFSSAVCAAGVACFAPINSPAFTGNPTAPTQPAGTNNTTLATTAFVTTAINNFVTGASFCAAVNACLQVSCSSIVANFPAAGAPPPATTRFLGSDCLSYTAAQILAGAGGVPSGATTGPHGFTNGCGGGQAWVGADDSAGPGIAQVSYNCNTGGPLFGGVVTNAQAALLRAGSFPLVSLDGCCPDLGSSAVQS
jgi:hypothetical protein